MDLKTILKRVAIKERIDEESVKIAYNHFIKELKLKLTSDEMPKVLIHNFGTFSVSLNRLESMMRFHIKRYLNRKLSKSHLKELLTPMFEVRRRLKQEQEYKNEKNKNNSRKKNKFK